MNLDPTDWTHIRACMNEPRIAALMAETGMDYLTARRSLQGQEIARKLSRRIKRRWR